MSELAVIGFQVCDAANKHKVLSRTYHAKAAADEYAELAKKSLVLLPRSFGRFMAPQKGMHKPRFAGVVSDARRESR